MDSDRVLTLLGRLEQYLDGLEEKQGCREEEYLDDAELQDVVERRFEKAIQACLDLAGHIVSREGYREPEDYGDLFAVLREENVLSRDLADKMVEMAGFRNVLAHEYARIDDERVYTHLQDLSRFEEFAAEVHAFLETDAEEG
ncbi:MAG: DUF86 domain-containing protein [Candidatus Nanohaloarchaea archaeon]|nr:DUF86 domain-containing protein [Candidatus Nanohaloarchaea archaeon]